MAINFTGAALTGNSQPGDRIKPDGEFIFVIVN